MKRSLWGAGIALVLTAIAVLAGEPRLLVAIVAMLLGWEVSDLYKVIRDRSDPPEGRT